MIKTLQLLKLLQRVFFDSSLNESLLFVQSGMMLVSVSENEKDYDSALKTLDKMIQYSESGLQPKLLYRKAEVAILKKDNKMATTVIEKLEKDHASSQEATEVTSLKALL